MSNIRTIEDAPSIVIDDFQSAKEMREIAIRQKPLVDGMDRKTYKFFRQTVLSVTTINQKQINQKHD